MGGQETEFRFRNFNKLLPKRYRKLLLKNWRLKNGTSKIAYLSPEKRQTEKKTTKK